MPIKSRSKVTTVMDGRVWPSISSAPLFSLIGDVGGDLRNPVQDREQGKVSLEVRVHLGAVEHYLGIFPVGHLLLRERGAEDILGQTLPSMTVVTLDLDLIGMGVSLAFLLF